MTRVVVVGAGVTGLTAAWGLRRHRPDLDVIVVEASARAGGLVHTSAFDDVALDTAADAFLARVPDALALCRQLGIADELVHPTNAGALVLTSSGLRHLPTGLVLGVPTDLDALAASGIVSAAGVTRAQHDAGPLPVGARAAGGDVSVGAMVRHRLGDEVMDELVAPLLGGVNAGDADRLSLAAGAPQLATVADAPDLLAALRSTPTTGSGRTVPPSTPAGPGGLTAPPTPSPVFAGFPTGTSTLIAALVDAIGPTKVHLGTAVSTVATRADGGLRLGLADGASLDADAVVLATPAHTTAPLLAHLDGDLDDVASGLADLEWASVAMVSLAIDTDRVAHPLDATGYLVPAHRRRTVTAASFASTKWAHLARPGRALLRVSAGHAGDDTPLDLDDTDLAAAVCDDLAEHIGLEGAPAAVRVTRWRNALPQYRPGHLERAADWQERVWSSHPGVWLTGASFAGLGLPACVRQGNEAAGRIADHLSSVNR